MRFFIIPHPKKYKVALQMCILIMFYTGIFLKTADCEGRSSYIETHMMFATPVETGELRSLFLDNYNKQFSQLQL